MHDDTALVMARIDRFAREVLEPAVHSARAPLVVTAWVAPGEPVPFAEAVRAAYTPFAAGSTWGRPWGTVWFHATGTVPAGWTRPELEVDLGFTGAQPGFSAEATVYAADGVVLGGIAPRRRTLPLPGPDVDVWVEAAANPDLTGGWRFAPTPLGDPATAGDDPLYRLAALGLAELDRGVWELARDVAALSGLVGQLPADLPRRAEVLRALERAVGAVDPDDVPGTAAAGREALAAALASPAHASAHRVHAVGHAHIDSAWLWPVRETIRKVIRTFANALALMDDDPEFVFAASSAQQYAWLAEHQPELFDRVKQRVAQGRFVPVGGMWVEPDSNLPGGEALARQFVMGERWFREELGVPSEGVWLPDSFGYSPTLPQLAAAAGRRWFLTQKLSWNATNRFPHHTFEWEGIDGTRLLTHFPPVDTYGAELSAAELARAQRQFAEKGHANTSLVPFGWGDGGGGPTREMLAAAARTRNLEGSPRVALSSPEAFFAGARREYADPPVWSGELYLELHRGTLTSQARTKRGNRRCEHLLREAELWAATAAVRTGAPYPTGMLRRCWRTVLLLQFHDVLPGTSIAWVHREAEREHARVAAELEQVIAEALAALTGPGEREIAANAGPYALDGVPALGAAAAVATPCPDVRPEDGGAVLQTAELRVVVSSDGLLTSVYDRAAGRELVPPGGPGNLLRLHRDTPARWDAWDLDAPDSRSGTPLRDARVHVEVGVARIERRFGASSVVQSLTLRGRSIEIDTEVDWQERRRLLTLAFPLDVLADRAASEIQFGHVFRPTHANTSWDAARFETCAHRWVHVGEPGYGVAVANDATYGHAIGRDGRTTTVRLSLLRAPTYPDPTADRGRHRFRVALRPGSSIGDAVSAGYRLNLPLRTVRGGRDVAPPVTVDDPAVVVEAVKLAEDGSGDVVVRLYEAFGTRASARIVADLPHREVCETDLHERPVPATALHEDRLRLRPFQIVTLRYRR